MDDAPEGVALDPTRLVGGNGRARGECLGKAEIFAREAQVRDELVARDDDPDQLRPEPERHVQRRQHPELPGELEIGFRVLDHGVDALAPSALEDAARLGP